MGINAPESPREEATKNRKQRILSLLKRSMPFASGVLAALLGIILYNLIMPDPPQITMREVNDSVAHAMASATPPPAYSASVYQIIQPSLVLIQSRGVDTTGKEENSLGSGVVVDDKGDILTSLHVVAGAKEIKLTFADGTESAGQVTARQEENDIAVLRATKPPAMIIPAVLGNPNAMRIGDEAFAVGNPFGLYGSMSSGVISGFDRSFQSPTDERRLKGLIQIDAAVNPGNSGGPLLNRDGQVVGIVVGILNPTDQDVFIGIGFAVPITIAGGAAGAPPY